MTQSLHNHEDKLLDFAYGELPAHEARAVEAHLAGCARCSGALADIRGVRQTMAQLEPVDAPDAGLESLLAYANQTARRIQAGPQAAPSRWRRWLAPVAGLAALCVLVVVVKETQPALKDLEPSAVAKSAQQARMDEGKAVAKKEAVPSAPAAAAPAPAQFGDRAPDAKAVLGEPVGRGGTSASGAAMSVDVASGPEKGKDKRAELQSGIGSSSTRPEPRRAAKADAELGRRDDALAEAAPQKKAKTVAIDPTTNSMYDTYGGAAPGAAARQERQSATEFLGKLSKARPPAPAPAKSAPAKELEDESSQVARAPAEQSEQDGAAGGVVASSAPPSTLTLGGAYGSGAYGGGRSNAAVGPSAPSAQPASPPPPPAATSAPETYAQSAAAPKSIAARPATTDVRSQLLALAKQAHARGDARSEQQALTSLLPYARSRDERRDWLRQLCDAEFQAGESGQGCRQLAAEFPESSEGQLATRRMKSSGADAQSGKKASSPAKAAPAKPANAY